MHRALSVEDVLYEIILQLLDPRMTAIPVWWMQHEPSVARTVAFLLSLSSVCKDWLLPARRAAYREVPLYLTTSRADSFLLAVSGSRAGGFVRGIIVDFPMPLESPDPEAALSVLALIFQSCPNLGRLHFDNLPERVLDSPGFVGLIERVPSINELGIRCLLSMIEWARPLAAFPSVPDVNVSSLTLSGVDLSALVDPRHYWLFRGLRWLHLHACNARSEFLALLGSSGSLEFLHVGRNVVDPTLLCQAWSKSARLRVFSFSQLTTEDLGGFLKVDRFSELSRHGIICRESSIFPYRP